MKKVIFLALMVLCFVPQAQAYVITGTVTADNHYQVYYGNATGSLLTAVPGGRNEYGTAGSSGGYNWSVPETFTFTTLNTDYLYVVAWDDASTANSWIGQFSATGMYPILSNTTSWVSKVGRGINPGETGDPVFTTVQADILAGGWHTPGISGLNGTSPWGTIPGISSQADFIWNDVFVSPNANDGHYAIFRALPTATPEPATMALFGIGLAGLGVLRRRKLEA